MKRVLQYHLITLALAVPGGDLLAWTVTRPAALPTTSESPTIWFDAYQKPDFSIPAGLDQHQENFLTYSSRFTQSLVTHADFQKSLLESYKSQVEAPQTTRHEQEKVLGHFEELTLHGSSIVQPASSSASKIVMNQAMQKLPFVGQFQSGMKFKLNFGDWFRGGSSSSATRQASSAHYGLVLKDIQPSHKDQRQAAVGVMNPEDVLTAGQAQVVWGIGLIEPDTSHNTLFSVQSPDANEDGAISSILDKMPRMSFDGQIKPRTAVSFTDPTSVPGMEMSVQQSDGWYRFDYLTRNNGLKESATHSVAGPIYDRMRLRQSFSEKFVPTKTSWENCTNSYSSSYLNLNVTHENPTVSSEMKIIDKRTSYVLTAERALSSETPTQRLELKYQQDF